MNLSVIKNAVTSKVGRSILLGRKHSPTILFAAGVVGVVATVILASRATLNLDATLQETQDKLEQAESLHDSGHASYTDADYKQDTVILYVQGAKAIAKLYWPAVLVGVASISALSGSHVILSRRNVGITAAYAAIEKGFAEYRQRVIDAVGPDKERELRYGSETREIIEETEEGPKVSHVTHVSPNGSSVYARFFDEYSKNWNRTSEYNFIFIRCQQDYANDLLRSRGHVFLNEVYDSLGIDRSKAGAVVGWVLSKDGDNFVDFGIFNGEKKRVRDFVNGREHSILLDFNVDGIIYDKI